MARSLAAIPDTSISGHCVARELTTLVARRGKPGTIVSDNVLCGQAKREQANRSPCISNYRCIHKIAPDGFHRQ